MSANPPKRDYWTPYRPDQQRFCLVKQPGRLKPGLGYVIAWPEPGTAPRYQVVWWDDQQATPGIRVSWLKRSDITPVFVDPNAVGDRRRR